MESIVSHFWIYLIDIADTVRIVSTILAIGGVVAIIMMLLNTELKDEERQNDKE